MLRASTKLLKINPYCQFLKESKGKHTGLGLIQRGRLLASLYRSLDGPSKKALVARANITHQKPRKPRPDPSQPKVKRTSKNPYILFCKRNFAKVEGRDFGAKVRKLAKLWKEQQ
jgi:hypothetical protein